MKKLAKKKRIAKKICTMCKEPFRTKGDICARCFRDYEMKEAGRAEMRALFEDMVHGQIGLAEFARQMDIDPDLIGARIIFSPLKRAERKPALPTKILLCRVGQVDGLGHEVTLQRLLEIANEYRNKGVNIEVNSAGEVWAPQGEGDGTEKAGA